MKNISDMSVTEIQFFDCTHQIQVGENEYEDLIEYSANIIFDDELVIQLSGNNDEAHQPSIPSAVECYFNKNKLQDYACEHFDIDDVIKALDDAEIENNFDFLKENCSL